MRLMNEGDYDNAVKNFQKVIDLNPNIAELHNLIGIAYLQRKETIGSAVHAFEEAVRLDPNLADAYNNLAIIYSGHIDDLSLAEEYFKKAIEKKPDFARAYFGLGWLYMTRLQEIEKAVPFLEKAVEYNPDHPESLYFLGIAYVTIGDRHKALMPISRLRLSGHNDLAQTLEAMIEQDSNLVRKKVLESNQQTPPSGGGDFGSSEPLDETGRSPVPWL